MVFSTEIKVCFSDIDNAGIVYYPRFLHYFHLAIEEFFGSELGVDYADVLHKRKVSMPTVHVEADFRRRMRYGDHIEMEVAVLGVGHSSIKWGYRGYRRSDSWEGNGRELVVEGSNVVVCVETDSFEKMEVPGWLRQSLTDYQARCNGHVPSPGGTAVQPTRPG